VFHLDFAVIRFCLDEDLLHREVTQRVGSGTRPLRPGARLSRHGEFGPYRRESTSASRRLLPVLFPRSVSPVSCPHRPRRRPASSLAWMMARMAPATQLAVVEDELGEGGIAADDTEVVGEIQHQP